MKRNKKETSLQYFFSGIVCEDGNLPYLGLYELYHESKFFLDLTMNNLMLNFSVFF